MQRCFLIIALVLIATLFVSVSAFSTRPEAHFLQDTPPPVQTQTLVPHIALLLPLESVSFGQAAEVVRQGFEAAARREQTLPLAVRLYSTTSDTLDILITYHEALNAGAVLVIGPLTRDGVTALASSNAVEVPTLTLNTPDTGIVFPPNLYLFGLQMENEASQIADLATAENKRHAIIIHDDSLLSMRLQTAFADRWLQYNPHASAESVRYYNDQSVLTQLRRHTTGENNLIFLALDAKKSRIITPYLNPDAPVYATSQIYDNDSNNDSLFNYDMNDIQFLDMPWLLQPDHPAVMGYRRTDEPKSTDMERLYALGIDAFRLMALMVRADSANEISLDGVTGHIHFVPPNQFVRVPVAARFNNGKVLLMNTKQGFFVNER